MNCIVTKINEKDRYMKHVAIFRQPFFNMVLNHEKTIESRWSNKKIAPFKKVQGADTIWLKETSKLVTAKAIVARVEYYELTENIADEINAKYGKQIGIDKFTNWDEVKRKKYCTLIWLKDVEMVEPFAVSKSHGAGWIVM